MCDVRILGTMRSQKITRNRVLGIGSAAGFDLLPFREQGWQVEGLEPNAAMAKFAREQLQLPTVSCAM